MATPEAAHRADAAEPLSQAELEADIVRTREQLGHTVEALAERVDVKTRTRNAVRDLRSRADPVLPYAAAVAAVALGALVSAVWSRRT